jgi:uncharacterized protein (TIGR02300 family)
MPELKLGTKFACFNCGTKFYDLGKSDPVCPKCGANQKDAAQSDLPAVSSARRRRKADAVKPIDVDEAEPIDADIDEDVLPEGIEGADLVGDDEEEEEDLDDEE